MIDRKYLIQRILAKFESDTFAFCVDESIVSNWKHMTFLYLVRLSACNKVIQGQANESWLVPSMVLAA